MRKEPKLLVLTILLWTNLNAQNDSIEAFWAQVDLSSLQQVEYSYEQQTIDFKKYGITTQKPSRSYKQLLLQIEKDSETLKIAYESSAVSIDSISNYFKEKLVNELIPYWYGTPWDFNGYTDKPNEGYIACGYFVSTTLKHMGINWNRYKMAQQASLLEVKTIAGIEHIYSFPMSTAQTVIEFIKNELEEGVYIVGLSNHVGFIYYKQGEVFFIHSNYGFPQEVVIEVASQSEVFRYSLDFYLGSITNNEAFMKKWVNKESVKVLTSN